MTQPAPPPPTSARTANFYDVIVERGLLAQCTDSPEGMRRRLASPITAYCGFDPTADSLHVGSLVPIMGLAHLQRAGHRPLVLVGGATGLVGDPSGKSSARQMLDEDQIRRNGQAIADQIGRFLTFGGSKTQAALVNNIDWIGPLTWLQVLRDIGSKVSVNRMMSMESVKQRMAGPGSAPGSETPGSDASGNTSGGGGGISYLEFSYMILQAYDFAHLFDAHGCTLQLGGQDQWGNIVMGTELGRKLHGADLAGLTFPLVTRSDGGKFGKSEAGNVWLDKRRTPPFEFFQFWRNVADADVGRYLGYFTFLPMDEVRELAAAQGAAINEAKVRLAHEVTRLVHGEAEADAARDAAARAFAPGASGGGGGSGGVDGTAESIPHQAMDRQTLLDTPLLALLQEAGFTKSNGEGRKLIANGGVRVGDQKITADQTHLTQDDLANNHVLLRAGKKRLYRFDVQQ